MLRFLYFLRRTSGKRRPNDHPDHVSGTAERNPADRTLRKFKTAQVKPDGRRAVAPFPADRCIRNRFRPPKISRFTLSVDRKRIRLICHKLRLRILHHHFSGLFPGTPRGGIQHIQVFSGQRFGKFNRNLFRKFRTGGSAQNDAAASAILLRISDPERDAAEHLIPCREHAQIIFRPLIGPSPLSVSGGCVRKSHIRL